MADTASRKPHQRRPHPTSVTNSRQTSELAFHFPRFSRTDAIPSAPPWPSRPRGGSGSLNLFERLIRRLVGGERRRDCVEVDRGSRRGVVTRWRTCHANKNTLCCIVFNKSQALPYSPRVCAPNCDQPGCTHVGVTRVSMHRLPQMAAIDWRDDLQMRQDWMQSSDWTSNLPNTYCYIHRII